MPQSTDSLPRDLRQRLAVLRETALQLLGECASQAPGGRRGADLMVALQNASNHLGVAEAALAPPHPASAPPDPGVMTPAPIGPPAPAPPRQAAAAQPNGAPERTTAEAAVVLALAETTVPFASSRQRRQPPAERRGESHLGSDASFGAEIPAAQSHAPILIQAVPLACELATRAEPRPRSAAGNPADPVAAVAAEAARLARRRGGDATTTLDVLFAALIDYGRLFDRALYLAGVSRRELIAELSGRAPVAR